MPLTLAEFLLRRRFPRRSTVFLIDAALLLGWTTVREIAELAEVKSRRRAELELAALVRDGWLVREERGPRNQAREVRFTARVAAIAGDRTAAIVDDRSSGAPTTRRTQARDHARQKDSVSLDPRSMDNTVRPSGGVQGGEPATDGRTEVEKRLQSAIAWVQERQGIAPEMSTAGLTRLLNAGASDHELRAYVVEVQRGTHSCLDGLETARFRFGSACTAKRFAIWRASRVRRARGPSVREQVERELERELEPTAMPAPDEMTAIAELVKARMK